MILPSASACWRFVEARFFENLRDLEFFEGFQGDMFGANGSGFDLLQGENVHFLVMRGFLVARCLEFASAGDDLAVNVLSFFLDGGVDGKQGVFGIEDLFDPGAEFRPGFGGEVEIRAQIEQSVLADLLADPS